MNGPIAPDAAAQEGWMEAQKAALKTGRLDQVLAALAGHVEAPEIDRDRRACGLWWSTRRVTGRSLARRFFRAPALC